MEKILNDLYRQIAETVNEMIPESWGKFYFYAQISDDGGGTYFSTSQKRARKGMNTVLRFLLNIKLTRGNSN